MYPVLFEVGGYAIHSYGFMLFLAFLTGIAWTSREAPKEGINRDHLYEAIIIAVILSLLGSRLNFVLINWELFTDEPFWSLFAFREGGLVFYGGLFAALLGVFLYCYYRGMSFLHLLDFTAPFIALGYAITRIGCFLNGCCYGHITDMPWGVVFPLIDQLPRHPTQLYASAAGLGIFLLLRRLGRYKSFNGYIFLLFLIFYSIYRFTVEFFRVSEPVVGVLSLAQLIALIILGAGLTVLLKLKSSHSQFS